MDCMNARVASTNIAVPRDNAAGTYSRTGIDKQPAESISVFAPGPNYGDGSGVTGDFIGDDQHHGGAHKAVYAFSREELDFWQDELGRKLVDGSFGENLTTHGIDLGGLGTLIASLASVISFKLYGNSKGASKGAYLKTFTIYNLVFLLILTGTAVLLLTFF